MKFVCAALVSLMVAGVVRADAISDRLSMAIASGNVAMAQAAIDQGADTNGNLGEGRTPLITAVMLTKPVMVKFLLEHGGDPNRTADDGAIGNALSAAFFASPGMALIKRADEDFIAERRGPSLECLTLIAAREPNFDILVSRGPTKVSPLMIAAEAGVADVVKILLEGGASPDFANGGRYTALDYAVDRAPVWSPVLAAERLEVVKLLLAAGAKKDRKGVDGLRPLDRARKAGNQAAVDLLSK